MWSAGLRNAGTVRSSSGSTCGRRLRGRRHFWTSEGDFRDRDSERNHMVVSFAVGLRTKNGGPLDGQTGRRGGAGGGVVGSAPISQRLLSKPDSIGRRFRFFAERLCSTPPPGPLPGEERGGRRAPVFLPFSSPGRGPGGGV